ncbi:MAG: ankyrin repeat domain-containing protein [Burkholderiales bacterium]|nr:ankyrin repeat domain-containing protein [Burkholderiales bacterium]
MPSVISCFAGLSHKKSTPNISAALETRLRQWADASPQGEDRAAVLTRIQRAYNKNLPELNLSDLKFSSLPIEPNDLPAEQRLNLGMNRIDQLSTAWVDKLEDLSKLGLKIVSLENQIEWADLLARGTTDTHKRASIYHNWHLGLRLALSGEHEKTIAGCNDAVSRLGMALSRSIQLEHMVPTIAKSFLAVAPPEVGLFEIDGVYIARSEIESLTAGLAGGKLQMSDQNRQNLDRLFADIKHGWSANVHQNGLLSTGALAWHNLQAINRVDPPTLGATEKHITTHLGSDFEAMEGLKFALQQRRPVSEDGLKTNVADTLRHVWAYCFRHETLKDSLIEAFASRLREIARDQCCNTGCVQRLLQTPEGIDQAFNFGLPDEKMLNADITRVMTRLITHLDDQIEQDQKAWTEAESQRTSNDQVWMQSKPFQPVLDQQAFEAQLQFKTRTVLSSIRKTFSDLQGIPTSMIDGGAERALDDLEKNELYLTDRTLGDLGTDYLDAFGRSALYKAVSQGDLESVHKQLEAGADVDFVTPKTLGALHLAVSNGNAEIVNLLLNAGADVNKATNNGAQALHFAAEHGNAEIVKLLLNAGGNANKASNDGHLALDLATRNGHAEIVKLLLNAGADANKARNNGALVLRFAAEHGHAEIAKLLLNAKVGVDKDFDDGTRALDLATRNGHAEIVKLLLNAGADVNKASNDGTRALHLATRKGHAEIVKLLLNAGADANKALNDGTRALHLATRDGHAEIVNLLLNAGAHVNKAAHNGDLALQLATRKGHAEIVKLLLNAGADFNKAAHNGGLALHLAVRKGHAEIVKILLSASSINASNQWSVEHSLNLAARMGHSDIVEILLSDSHINASDQRSVEYSLGLATKMGHGDIVDLLRAHLASIPPKPEKGFRFFKW